MKRMIALDGAQGEGGGQILRSALSLSMITGQPFTITSIRAGRAKPGLLRQHLTAVKAATEICGATVEGAELGSQRLLITRPAPWLHEQNDSSFPSPRTIKLFAPIEPGIIPY